MDGMPRKDTDEHPIDDQTLRTGRLDEDDKLDIALEGSMLTSEPPQITEPKSAEDDPATLPKTPGASAG